MSTATAATARRREAPVDARPADRPRRTAVGSDRGRCLPKPAARSGRSGCCSACSWCSSTLLPLLEIPILSTTGHRLRRRALHRRQPTCWWRSGLNIVLGYAGLLDLGYVGFFAIGAYTVALLRLPARRTCPGPAAASRWPSLVTTSPASCSGAPTLRVRGDYLAIVTLGFGEIIRLIAVN